MQYHCAICNKNFNFEDINVHGYVGHTIRKIDTEGDKVSELKTELGKIANDTLKISEEAMLNMQNIYRKKIADLENKSCKKCECFYDCELFCDTCSSSICPGKCIEEFHKGHFIFSKQKLESDKKYLFDQFNEQIQSSIDKLNQFINIIDSINDHKSYPNNNNIEKKPTDERKFIEEMIKCKMEGKKMTYKMKSIIKSNTKRKRYKDSYYNLNQTATENFFYYFPRLIAIFKKYENVVTNDVEILNITKEINKLGKTVSDSIQTKDKVKNIDNELIIKTLEKVNRDVLDVITSTLCVPVKNTKEEIFFQIKKKLKRQLMTK